MKIIRILYYLARRTDRRWALSEINPLNPDVTKLVLEERVFSDRLRQAWSS